jgi:hypothetical protein
MPNYHTTSQGNVPFTVEEELEWEANEARHQANKGIRQAENVRRDRDSLIAATDWTQCADIDQATKDKWSPYRKALRDVPQQAGFPFDVIWPT